MRVFAHCWKGEKEWLVFHGCNYVLFLKPRRMWRKVSGLLPQRRNTGEA